MPCAPIIFGCSGTVLSEEEIIFLSSVNPYGFILFDRNISEPQQLRNLTNQLREVLNRPRLPILIDQEGGRVTRLRPPNWATTPSAGALVEKFVNQPELAAESIRLNSRLIAHDLIISGISVACMPVLDLVIPGGHEVIGDRAYSADPHQVSQYGRAACEGLLECGVLPIIKHIPGHGRSTVDSHLVLSRVDTKIVTLAMADFLPFRELREMPMAMTAHIVYSEVDPVLPATLSPDVIGGVIRNTIAFEGLLITDDIGMGALSGNLGDRAAMALEAGCDVILHCSGDLPEMKEVASAVPSMAEDSRGRALRCEAMLRDGVPLSDSSSDRRELIKLLQA